MDLGLRVCLLMFLYLGWGTLFYIYSLYIWVIDVANKLEQVVLPELVAPTIITPNLTLKV